MQVRQRLGLSPLVWSFPVGDESQYAWTCENTAAGAQADPAGPDEGVDRVAWGGGFDDQRWSARSAARFAFTPFGRFDNVGVRLVRIR